MAKHKPDKYEYFGEWDDGTYQTGTIRPPKPGSGLVAFLLALVILLGGICSALGIINVQLLSQLAQKEQETTPLSKDSQPTATGPNSYLDQLDAPIPQVPENATVTLQIADSPYYPHGEKQDNLPSQQQIFDQSQQYLLDVQCLTHIGEVQSGIALVLSADGFLLTNHHVVDAARRIFVTLPDGNIVRAALVGTDSFSDLALLYIQAEGLTPAVFSSNKTLQVTDPSYAIEPGNQGRSLRESSIFNVSRIFAAKNNSLQLIQTCAGGQAGVVFDSFGYVMGFQVGHIAHYFGESDTTGTGLVIPTRAIRQIVNKLLSHGCVEGRPSLGIEVEAISKVYQQYWQLPLGLLLTDVAEHSHAAACGLEEGDILLALNGVPVTNRSELYAMLYNHNIGDTVIAVVSRDDQKFTVKLTIEENKK